jgi:hypothetical protein
MIALLAALLAPLSASAQIIVSPLRQTIDPARPEAHYAIVNPTNRILVARVRWIDLESTIDGYAAATGDHRAAYSAAPFLVVSPSTLRLEPGARDEITVRLKARKTAPPGERRSHLLIETDAARTPIRKAGGGLEVDIGTGVSTPVIVRGGPPSPPAVAFGPSKLVRMDDGRLALEVRLQRTGGYSAFGRLSATVSANGQSRRVGSLSNVAVYPDAHERLVRLPLDRSALPAGVLKVVYEGEAEYAGLVFAEKKFDVAPAE